MVEQIAKSVVTVVEAATDYQLNVNVYGSGNVFSSEGRIDCGTDCESSFAESQVVILVATPAEGFILDGWEGKGRVQVSLQVVKL